MRRAVLAAVAALLSLPALAGEDNAEMGSTTVGAWQIKAFGGEVSKQFSHCTASTIFQAKTAEQRRKLRSEEVFMFVGLRPDGYMSFGLVGLEWKLTESKSYRLDFVFDEKAPFNIDGVATGRQTLQTSFAGDADWFTAIAAANSVELKIQGSSIGKFNLKNSASALSELTKCVAAFDRATKPEDPSFGGGDDAKPRAGNGYDITGDTF